MTRKTEKPQSGLELSAHADKKIRQAFLRFANGMKASKRTMAQLFGDQVSPLWDEITRLKQLLQAERAKKQETEA